MSVLKVFYSIRSVAVKVIYSGIALSVLFLIAMASSKDANSTSAITVFAYLVSAAFAGLLAILTYALVGETKSLRDQNAALAREAKQPVLIIYTDLDEHSRLATIILENVSDNPAFNVRLTFSPDTHFRMRKEPHKLDRNLSRLMPQSIDVFGPRQKIIRTFGIFSDLSGAFGPIPEFETTAEITFEDHSGTEHCRAMKLSSAPIKKQFFEDKSSEGYRNKAIENAGKEVAKAVLGLRHYLASAPKE